MITENSIIFIVEDNKAYGKAVQSYLTKVGFKNVMLFQDEEQCLNNMDKHPEVLISDYNLSGLQLFEQARRKKPGLYSILLSDTFGTEWFGEGKPLRNINQFIKKDGNEFLILTEVLYRFMDPAYVLQFY